MKIVNDKKGRFIVFQSLHNGFLDDFFAQIKSLILVCKMKYCILLTERLSIAIKSIFWIKISSDYPIFLNEFKRYG